MIEARSGVVVTGAAGGIGRALASKLAAEGCRVVVSDLGGGEEVDRLQDLAATIDALAVPADASTVEGVAHLVETARAHLGGIDAWFGNAGIFRSDGLDLPDDQWHASHEVNVMSHVRAARLLLPDWLASGSGRFVVTASAAGLLTALTAPAYSVTKHGAIAFAEWLSATYRHRGVVVQAICPQGVRTGMLEETGPLKDLASHDVALTPEDVAEAAWQAALDDRFYVLPHPRVGEYFALRARDPDRWLQGINLLQQKLELPQEAGDVVNDTPGA